MGSSAGIPLSRQQMMSLYTEVRLKEAAYVEEFSFVCNISVAD